MDNYKHNRRYLLQKEFSGQNTDGGETNIRLYKDRENPTMGVVSIEYLKASGSAIGTTYYDGTLGHMEGEYDRQIMVWNRSEISAALEAARAAGHYDGLE